MWTRNVIVLTFWSLLKHAQALETNIRGGLDADAQLSSGDAIFLQAESGGFVVSDSKAPARIDGGDLKGSAPIFIRKAGGGTQLYAGDTIYLVDGDGNAFGIEDGKLWARSKEVTADHKFKLLKAGDSNVTGVPMTMSDYVRLQLVTPNGGFLEGHDGKVSVVNAPGKTTRFGVKRLPYGGLHDVVGPDGVLMITLQREGEPRRSGYSLRKLEEAQIFPVEFAATDAKSAPYWELHLTCPLESETGTASWCNDMGRYGQPGCRSQVEQAITDSHRRALISAMSRDSQYEWTAIIEDDVIPFEPQQFSAAFRKAWRNVPEEARIVRLGWCTFEGDLGVVNNRALKATTIKDLREEFKLVREQWWTDKEGGEHYYTGGCTTGYMVHRSFIPEMLKIFPCCCPIDCCLERQLFYAPAKNLANSSSDEYARWRGPEIMIQMDGWNSRGFSKGFASFNQSGVLLQDNRKLQSERPAWNQVN